MARKKEKGDFGYFWRLPKVTLSEASLKKDSKNLIIFTFISIFSGKLAYYKYFPFIKRQKNPEVKKIALKICRKKENQYTYEDWKMER